MGTYGPSWPVELQAVDRVEITVLVDNYVDLLLPGSHIVTRPFLREGEEIARDTVVAGHGLSMLVETFQGGERRAVLFDTGYTERAVLHNVKLLGIDLIGIDSIVLSHAHMDHTGGLYPILEERKITGVGPVHAILGGFHLTGPLFEPIIGETVAAIKEIDPKVIVPMHCTGWSAVRSFFDAFPASFVLSSVGSRFMLTCGSADSRQAAPSCAHQMERDLTQGTARVPSRACRFGLAI